MWKNIVTQAIPLMLAQLAALLYNVVDRIYIGHLPGADSMALTGIGLVFPLTSLVAAFTNLFGTGGAPLFAIARGAGEEERAKKILGNVFSLLCATSFVILAVCYIFKKPILYLFGASDASYVYANTYLKIYLLGTPFIMLSTGLNGFINAQGFPRMGMVTTLMGAALNLALDPIFIFALNMGIAGAALATLISQTASAVWVLAFLRGKKAPVKIEKQYMKIDAKLTGEITALGFAGFIMQVTNCIVQAVSNATLKIYGGDLYVGISTVVNSVREILQLPVLGLMNGAQPVISYNYGAKEYKRVKTGIKIMALGGMAYTLLAWGFVLAQPHLLMAMFTNDALMISEGVTALHLYFFGFFFMAFQYTGQTTFTALGYSKQAVFFSLLRKVVIVVPLTILLPRLGFGANGVFIAEPVSNAIGGLACFATMMLTVYRKLASEQKI